MKPLRKFIGIEGQKSRDATDMGAKALRSDLDAINKMFDPNAVHEDAQPGGIATENIRNSAVTDSKVGPRTADQNIVADPASTGTLTQLFSWIVKVMKGITGEDNWYTVPLKNFKEITTDNEQAVAAEIIREANEVTREDNESGRVTAEGTRVTQENTRITNENSRVTAESARATNESTRQSNEATRTSQENTRVSQENTRQTNESGRVTAENTRVTNENTRIAEFDNFDHRGEYASGTAYYEKNIVSYLGSSYMATQTSTGVVPTDTDYWNLIGAGGAALNYRGHYDELTQYQKDDLVTYGGNIYVNLVASLGISPLDTNYWAAFITATPATGVARSKHTLTAAGNSVPINIEDYDTSIHYLIAFKNTVFIEVGDEYSLVSNTHIQKNTGTWETGTVFYFNVIRGIKGEPGADADGLIIREDSTLGFRLEVRTTDPAAPPVGQMWFRSDLS